MRHLSFVLAFCMLTCGLAKGDETGELAHVASDALLPLLGYALYDTLSSDDATERETGRRLVDALLITGTVTALGKQTITSRRPEPNSNEKDGMPSGHSAMAFAAATVLAERDSQSAALAYGLAGLIAWSRGETKRHRTDQIVAGSALGYLVGRQAASGEWHIYSDGDNEVVSIHAFGAGGCGKMTGFSLTYRTVF